jgi:predicted transcriptional regulator
VWQPLLSAAEAQALQAYEQLQQFLAIGNPDIVAAFADKLDRASIDQIEAIAQKLAAIRTAREKQ